MNGVRPASALYGRREAHTTGKPASERKPLVEVRSFAPCGSADVNSIAVSVQYKPHSH